METFISLALDGKDWNRGTLLGAFDNTLATYDVVNIISEFVSHTCTSAANPAIQGSYWLVLLTQIKSKHQSILDMFLLFIFTYLFYFSVLIVFSNVDKQKVAKPAERLLQVGRTL